MSLSLSLTLSPPLPLCLSPSLCLCVCRKGRAAWLREYQSAVSACDCKRMRCGLHQPVAYTHTHTHTHTHTRIHMHVYTYTCIHIYERVRTCVCGASHTRTPRAYMHAQTPHMRAHVRRKSILQLEKNLSWKAMQDSFMDHRSVRGEGDRSTHVGCLVWLQQADASCVCPRRRPDPQSRSPSLPLAHFLARARSLSLELACVRDLFLLPRFHTLSCARAHAGMR